MIPTPDLSHLTRHDLEQVYDPAGKYANMNYTPTLIHLLEDTFLLLDALEQEAGELRKERPMICVEVG